MKIGQGFYAQKDLLLAIILYLSAHKRDVALSKLLVNRFLGVNMVYDQESQHWVLVI